MAIAMDKQAADTMTSKVAAMNSDQRWARMTQIADSGDVSDETALEFVKLFFGPDAVLSEE